MTVLVVGAGFAGATIARVLADAGINVHLIDKRPHIGGNAFDQLNAQGERVHRYGPHLLHGSASSEAVAFLSRFCAWIPYEHRVRALLPDGRTTPLPVNRTTLEDVFAVQLANEAETQLFLDSLRSQEITPCNSDQLFQANVGEQLADLFFRPYTRKMWGVDASELAIGIGARLPVRTDRDERYFTDSFQALPRDGYTDLFRQMLDHPLISIELGCLFDRAMEPHYQHCFLSVPIDQYFDHCYGVLPYRSILFHQRMVSAEQQPAPVINFTDSGVYTRSTEWGLLPNSAASSAAGRQVTLEEPCSMERNPGEYYYPVQTKQSQQLLARYQQLAQQRDDITFCGRTGLFRYIDMLPAVTLHLAMARRYLDQALLQAA